MRLSQKLILFVLAAAVLPLSVAGFWLLREAETELAARLEREQKALAIAAAEASGTQLSNTLDSLAQTSSILSWPEMSRAEVEGALRLLAGQTPLVVGATWSGSGDAPLLERLEGRPAVPLTREALLSSLPLETLAAYGEKGLVAVGPAQDSPVGPWLPAAIQVGAKGPQPPMVVLALTLSSLDQWLVEHASPVITIEIVDGDGRVVASSEWHAKVRELQAGRLGAVRTAAPLVVTEQGEQVATARVPGRLGLVSVVSTPLEAARAPVRTLRRTVIGGMAVTLVLLVVGALVFVRRITSRLERVASVANAFGRGELSQRVEVSGDDELGELAATFNGMGAELEAARAKLLRWNDELKQKVDEATADLRAAQAQLVEAQKLAAIGQLGAGVAHEINNPLVGILGNAQLLLLDHQQGDPDFSVLQQIEDSAKRCRDITQQLLRFSQKRGEVHLAPIDLVRLVKRTMEVERPRHDAAKVTVALELPDTMMIDGDEEQLEQVLSQLCGNARTAMAASAEKKLTLSVTAEGDDVRLAVTDTGKGIPKENLERVFEPFFTTKDVWSNIGLGLSVSYRIIEEHDGRIEVSSEPGKGARFTVRLKRAGTSKPKGAVVHATIAGQGVGGTGKGITG